MLINKQHLHWDNTRKLNSLLTSLLLNMKHHVTQKVCVISPSLMHGTQYDCLKPMHVSMVLFVILKLVKPSLTVLATYLKKKKNQSSTIPMIERNFKQKSKWRPHLKGIVHLKTQFLSSLPYTQVIANLHDDLLSSVEH